MKRFFVFVFLFLYAYNIVGYLALFSFLQQRVKREVKLMLKASVPESDLARFAFHTSSLKQNAYALQWIEDHEFRYEGKFYDIVRSQVIADTTYFVCINDTQEEQLFAHLDSHVHRNMADSGQPSKFDSFKDVFKDSLTRFSTPLVKLVAEVSIAPLVSDSYISVEMEIPFLPPRALSL